MIRPINVILALLACGSGLYLYQAKHRVNVLDRQIEATVKQTADLRARTRMLEADWMVLNDPQRLQALSGQLLTDLQPVAPSQFTTMAELDSRLPPVGPPPPQSSDLIATAGPAAVDRHDSGPPAAFAGA
ncbi:MAG: hypothetical protein KGL12_05090, partial [Rhodospirillales bacterium]|nr:hypothetical protein [Rhodospirillales bacterium]